MVVFTIFCTVCANRKVTETGNSNINTPNTVVELMTGTFSSAEQSQRDSLFYDISLTMMPIWNGDANVKWLYVEQAVSDKLKKLTVNVFTAFPYCQTDQLKVKFIHYLIRISIYIVGKIQFSLNRLVQLHC